MFKIIKHCQWPLFYKLYFNAQGIANGYTLMIDPNSDNHYSPLEIKNILGLSDTEKQAIMIQGQFLIDNNSK